ncbi:MAG: hypothetical protein ACTSRS_14870 [Candidatus Helarchaeota archaeon]
MEWYSVINLIFSINGIILFIYSSWRLKRIITLLPTAKIMRYWRICRLFIMFFTIGYLVNVLGLIFNQLLIQEIMYAMVYLIGAIFVAGVIEITYVTFRLIVEAAEGELKEN